MESTIIIASMEPQTGTILKHRKINHLNESRLIGIATIPNSSSTLLRSFLWVSDHPSVCVNRIYLSSSFQKLRATTLKRLSFSNHPSIRSAAELELTNRNGANNHG